MSHPDYKNIGEAEDRVIEECSELIKAICKARRFGWENYHPTEQPSVPNRTKVIMEIHDCRDAFRALEDKIYNSCVKTYLTSRSAEGY
jgi:hypothetical protein